MQLTETTLEDWGTTSLQPFLFHYCLVSDFDCPTSNEKDATRRYLIRIIHAQQIPCVLEETTRGFHLIILSDRLGWLDHVRYTRGFSSPYHDLSYGKDRLVAGYGALLRTVRKEGEIGYFIKGREYFYQEDGLMASLIEFGRYSDKLLLNSMEFWRGEEMNEEDWGDEF